MTTKMSRIFTRHCHLSRPLLYPHTNQQLYIPLQRASIHTSLLASKKLWHNKNDAVNARSSFHQSVPHRQNVTFSKRTHMCGDLSVDHVGNTVQLSGWIQSTRMDKFIILRDRTGLAQIFVEDSSQKNVLKLNNESVITISGIVRKRPEGQENVKLGESGRIEVELTQVLQVSEATDNMPFQNKDQLLPKEELRMQYRYLDLRRQKLQKIMKFRSDFVMGIRQFLVGNGFLDVETPTLFRRTPGGAKEFVVPTQIEDKFYSLVQSPQQFKQLLMVGGIDRYFQIARCYRDEGGKPDRQPEFTQVDIEMSFVDREDVLTATEQMIASVWPSDRKISLPLPRITYEEAITKYGSDKPDLRYDNEIQIITDSFQQSNFSVLDENLGGNENIAAMITFEADDSQNPNKIIKTVDKESKKSLKDHLSFYSSSTLKIMSPVVIQNGQIVNNGVLKKCSEEVRINIEKELRCKDGIGFLAFGPKDFVLPVLGKQRTLLAKYLLPDLNSREQKMFWVIDFPLFLYEEGVLESAHHPFTSPHPEDYHLLRTDPLKCRSLHYDLVLNGQEIGGGSVRIHNSSDQRYVLQDILKEDTSELDHLLKALDCGCPPHAGIALGLDRVIAILTDADSIRDVIAFPKSSDGKDLMAGAPATITDEQREMYFIKKSK
eukprot:TRINITY_DN2983_c0_g1_i5.p1 TRINITY_DN2983_c0_g1~~TRINITY_DN2983_c0_g1_i5.p1  ORF type:complete len:660 (-),score=122.70 TRINITY_DN2983_c0_g1_i5:187-2166(-)